MNSPIAHREAGFTLIEALIALMIAATALVVLMERLGLSADIQRSLALHEIALDQAHNKLNELSMLAVSNSEQQGSIEVGEMQLEWRSWVEETTLDGFVRLNVSMKIKDQPEVVVFLYQEMR